MWILRGKPTPSGLRGTQRFGGDDDVWRHGWRARQWSELDRAWDLIVIGGGITGAGILREATRVGVRTLLIEADDFASGTSSRSSKLVHGGFRYLRHAQVRLTYEAVRERERLLKQGRGLVNPLSFLMVSFSGDRIPQWVFGVGLSIYDLLAFKWRHQRYDAAGLRGLTPYLNVDGLVGGYRYFDAEVDDARLVLRMTREAVGDGGAALNYARVESLLRRADGTVNGVAIRDELTGKTAEVKAPVVINATGAWADELRAEVGGRRRLRKLRGGHLVFPATRFPLTRALSFLQPSDGRPVFAFPWEGVTVVGTTDVDHGPHLEPDPAISPAEADYLLTAARFVAPSLELGPDDVQCSFAGVRAVVDTRKANPSRESREHVLWKEAGLLTVTGGKLTTFRVMAHEALRAVRARLPSRPAFDRELPVFDEPAAEMDLDPTLDPSARLRLLGRYGAEAPQLLAAAGPGELTPIGESPSLWAELRWAARAEGVAHLDDLLLRRVRLGLQLPQGGLPWLERIRAIVQPELGWDDERWAEEVAAYGELWERSYHLPGRDPARRLAV